jgi:hypothetical protein
MILETGVNALVHASVAVHVSVTVPPHGPDGTCALKVELLEVPEMRQPPESPLVKLKVLGAGRPPQTTVIGPGAVIVGSAAGLTVMTRDTGVSALVQASVAVQVSVTVPPHAPGVVVNVDRLEVPLMRQPSVRPLVKLNVLAAGIAPQATVMGSGAVMVGRVAGLMVISLVTGTSSLSQASTAVQVSVTFPPQASGIALNVDPKEVPLRRQLPEEPLE